MRLTFWTWVVDVLDDVRLYARARKMQAVSDRLMVGWQPIPPDKTYDSNIVRLFEHYERKN